MILVQVAFAAITVSQQSQLDQSGLPKLKEIMKVLQSSHTCQITGSRFIETSPGNREYEGDIQIFRQKNNLRYSYCGYFGDNFTLIINPEFMSTASDFEATVVSVPQSWAKLSGSPAAQSNGGLPIAFLANEKDLNLFVDTSKAITLDSKTPNEVSFFHTDGSKHSVRLLQDETVEFLTTTPGFGGFRPPTTEIDSIKVKDRNPKFPAWYFQIKN